MGLVSLKDKSEMALAKFFIFLIFKIITSYSSQKIWEGASRAPMARRHWRLLSLAAISIEMERFHKLRKK